MGWKKLRLWHFWPELLPSGASRLFVRLKGVLLGNLFPLIGNSRDVGQWISSDLDLLSGCIKPGPAHAGVF